MKIDLAVSLISLAILSFLAVGDVIGWAAVILAFVFVIAVIYLIFRAANYFYNKSKNPYTQSNVDNLILEKIKALDIEIKKLHKERKEMEERFALRISELEKERDELKQQAREHFQLRRELEEKGVAEIQSPKKNFLIAAVGSADKSLGLDITSLLAVQTKTGMLFEEIEATPVKLKESLDRARRKEVTVYLHLAVKSDESGYELMGEIVDASWLAPVLQGVTVLLVAGNNSSTVGDLLGVVPFVITINSEIPPRDAASFTREFWTEIGLGRTPDEALQAALRRAPSGLSRYIVSHWG